MTSLKYNFPQPFNEGMKLTTGKQDVFACVYFTRFEVVSTGFVSLFAVPKRSRELWVYLGRIVRESSVELPLLPLLNYNGLLIGLMEHYFFIVQISISIICHRNHGEG